MLTASTFSTLEAPGKLGSYDLDDGDKANWKASSPRMKMVLWLVSNRLKDADNDARNTKEEAFFDVLARLKKNGFVDLPSIAGVGIYGTLTAKKLASDYDMSDGAASHFKAFMQEAQKAQLKSKWEGFWKFLHKYNMTDKDKSPHIKIRSKEYEGKFNYLELDEDLQVPLDQYKELGGINGDGGKDPIEDYFGWPCDEWMNYEPPQKKAKVGPSVDPDTD
jgi:hypothetical protein